LAQSGLKARRDGVIEPEKRFGSIRLRINEDARVEQALRI
jgi:hypothetical protein